MIFSYKKEQNGICYCENRNGDFMERSYGLGEVEDVITELDLIDAPDDVMEGEGDYQVVISGWWVYIPELGMRLHEGTFCNFDENEQEYLPYFSITVI